MTDPAYVPPFLALDDRMPERLSITLALQVVLDDAVKPPLPRLQSVARGCGSAYAHRWACPELHDASIQRIAIGAAFQLGLEHGIVGAWMMLIAYYLTGRSWSLSIESVDPRWSDMWYPCNASEWIVPGTIDG